MPRPRWRERLRISAAVIGGVAAGLLVGWLLVHAVLARQQI